MTGNRTIHGQEHLDKWTVCSLHDGFTPVLDASYYTETAYATLAI